MTKISKPLPTNVQIVIEAITKKPMTAPSEQKIGG